MSSEFSRRDFLKLSELAIYGTFGAKLVNGVIPLARLGEEIPPRIIETNTANFTGLFGIHGHDKLPVPSQAIQKEIFGNSTVDAVFLESAQTGIDPLNNYEWALLNDQLLSWFSVPWYKSITPDLLENKIPILLGDMPTDSSDFAPILVKGALLQWASFVGAALGTSRLLAENFQGQMTRGEFLKKSGAALAALWGWTYLGAEFMRNSPSSFQDVPWVENLRKFASFGEFLHLEDLLINFRNALVAEKLLYYAEQKATELGRRPNITILMGIGHGFLPEYLKRGKEFCLNYLKLYPDWFTESLFGREKVQIYAPAVTELTPKGDFVAIKTTFDPELQKIFGPKIE